MISKDISKGVEIDTREHTIFVIVCLLAFSEPALFSHIGIIDTAYSALKLLCSLGVILYAGISYYKKLKISAHLMMYILFWMSFLISALFVGNEAMSAIRTVVYMLTIGLLFSVEFALYPKLFLRRIQSIYSIYIISSFLLSIIFPHGFGEYISGYNLMVDSRLNLLGLDNALIYPILIFLVSTYSCHALGIEAHVLKPCLASLICLSYELYVWSGTGLIAVVTALVLLFCVERRFMIVGIIKRHFLLILSVYLFVVASLVIFDSYTVMLDFFQDYLNKGSSLLGRSTLWKTTIEMFGKSPLYGLGLGTEVLSTNLLFYSPHNLILQILLYGGFVSLILFISILVSFSRSVSLASTNESLDLCGAYAAAGLLSFLVVGFTESCLINTTLVFLLSMGWFISHHHENEISRVSD